MDAKSEAIDESIDYQDASEFDLAKWLILIFDGIFLKFLLSIFIIIPLKAKNGEI
ncbi:MAG: hypothetical protein WC556_07565 [Candidatus Methanoperedens sp.]